MSSRFYRSTRETFPCERFPATFGPYRRPSFVRHAVALVAVLALFATIGALMAQGV